jgi:hypothetical protein
MTIGDAYIFCRRDAKKCLIGRNNIYEYRYGLFKDGKAYIQMLTVR